MTEADEAAPSPSLERRWSTIRAKLDACAEDLLTQGVLAPKLASGRRVWAVRYVARRDGRNVHRSIYVGGDDQPELLRRTRRLLEEYRTLGRLPDDVADYARFVARLNAIVRRRAAPPHGKAGPLMGQGAP